MSVYDQQHGHWAAWRYEETRINEVESAKYRAHTAKLERARLKAQANVPERYQALLGEDVSSAKLVKEEAFPKAGDGSSHPYGVRSVYAVSGCHIEIVKIGGQSDLSARPATLAELHGAPVFCVSVSRETPDVGADSTEPDFSLYPLSPRPTMFDHHVGARLFLDTMPDDFAADLQGLDARLRDVVAQTSGDVGHAAVAALAS